MILLNNFLRPGRDSGRQCTVPWLIRKLLLYLTGFLKHRIQPKTRKDSQKVAGEKYGGAAFTMLALTMIRLYTSGPHVGINVRCSNAE